MTTTSAEVSYSEKIVWGPAYPLAGLIAIIGVVQLFSQWVVGAILVGGAGLVVWFSTARYVVSEAGVDVFVGGGRPHIHVAGDEIASVGPTRLTLRTAGGWGYRGSWTLLRGVAISLGGNGAVAITTRSGKKLRLASKRPNELLTAMEAFVE